MSYFFGALAAIMLIVGLFRVSLWLTERKSTEELKKRLPDASDIHRDGGALS